MKFYYTVDLCESFSKSKKKLNAFKYLGLFSKGDVIPDQYYENPENFETVAQKNLCVTEKLLFASERAQFCS